VQVCQLGLKNLPRGVRGSIRGSIMSRQSFLMEKLTFFDKKQEVLIRAKKGDEKFNDRFEPLFKCILPLGRARFFCKFAHFWEVS
jgi:hypothetical protein